MFQYLLYLRNLKVFLLVSKRKYRVAKNHSHVNLRLI